MPRKLFRVFIGQCLDPYVEGLKVAHSGLTNQFESLFGKRSRSL
jgi:hypothetical protein